MRKIFCLVLIALMMMTSCALAKDVSDEEFTDAVTLPTRADAEAAELELPEPGEGETLWLGIGEVKEAESLLIAFVLSEDGTQMHDVTIKVTGVPTTFVMNGQRLSVTASKTFNLASPSAFAETVTFTPEAVIEELALADGTGSGVMHYTWTNEDEEIVFEPIRVVFAQID